MIDRINIEIDVSHVRDMAANLTKKSAEDAWRRTLGKLGVWVKGQTAKAVSKEARIAQKLVRKRIYFFLRSWSQGKVWLGLNSIPARRLGRLQTTSKGITAGRHRFPGAWTMTKVDPDGPVYVRVGEERRPYKKRRMYKEVKFDWEQAGERAFREAAKRAEVRLIEILRQEINYEIHKAIGNAK